MKDKQQKERMEDRKTEQQKDNTEIQKENTAEGHGERQKQI